MGVCLPGRQHDALPVRRRPELLDAYAWYNTRGQRENAVGKLKPNAWGLHDVLGNIWEWCADWYDEHYYGSSPPADPPGPSEGWFRVCRGGQFPAQVTADPRFASSKSRGTGPSPSVSV